MNKLMALLFDVTLQTVYKKKKKNDAYLLIDKYLSEDEILEFLEKKEIKKFEIIKNYTIEELEKLLPKIEKNNKIEIIKKIKLLKKNNLRLLFTFLKYNSFDSSKKIEENINIFQKEYKISKKINNSINDNIILFSHHFQASKKSFQMIFNKNDFINMFEEKEFYLEEIQKEIQKIF